jgi:hypothetical protein
MSQHPKFTGFVSEIDQYLQKFDKQHPKPSLSQQKEREKYLRIYFLRDQPTHSEPIKKIWENF